MYARKRDRELQQAKISKKGNTDPAKVTLMKLKEIDDCKLYRVCSVEFTQWSP